MSHSWSCAPFLVSTDAAKFDLDVIHGYLQDVRRRSALELEKPFVVIAHEALQHLDQMLPVPFRQPFE